MAKDQKKKLTGKSYHGGAGRLGGKIRGLWTERKPQRQIKDRVFRFFFEKDHEALLQLYNALNGTNYTDPEQLEIVTIESAVYVTMKNDLAFMLTGVLNLYEHQSTVNPNIPVRFLVYLGQEYQKIVERAEESLYGTRQIPLPTPKCVVFYNGEENVPEEQIICLSDAYMEKASEADVELKVKVLNINYGHNQELMRKCRMLEQYAQLVEATRRYAKQSGDLQEAMNKAIDYCIESDILKEFLIDYRAEVLGMILESYDKEKYERSLRRDGWEEGIEQSQRITIRNLTERGFSDEEICNIVECTFEKLAEIKQKGV